jgi:hypothetical protein
VTDRAELEERLAAASVEERLAALGELCASAPRGPRRGVNLHIHTNHSFSSFRSPSEAVWQAVREKLAVLGINDHYTFGGFEEFRAACAIAELPATYSMEAVAVDRQARREGVLTNDPGNPGRTYLCAKGTTALLAAENPFLSKAVSQLADLCVYQSVRNREMTARVEKVFRKRLGCAGPSWEDVEGLVPGENVTERHIARAVHLRLLGLAEGEGASLEELLEKLCAARPPEDRGLDAVQGFIRSSLLKAGRPCFVKERPEAFLSVANMRDMFLVFGAVPTYPVLLDPVTEGERDLRELLDSLQARRFYALEVIPHRNSRERLSELVGLARERWWPVFTGSEHNTPQPRPLLDAFSLDPQFEDWFAASAAVLLGHQAEAAAGRAGFVGADGTPSIAYARERFEHFRAAGEYETA